MTDTRLLAKFRDQIQADIDRPDGRWGMHGHSCVDDDYFLALEWVVKRLDERLAEQHTDGLPMVIAGAIFDFAGYLTTRDAVIRVGSPENASPIADLVKEWAAQRGLSLADAAVLSWQETLAEQPEPWQPVPPRSCIKPTVEAADAFWKYWRENGETHKHGYCESTWGAINKALACGWTPPAQATVLTDEEIAARPGAPR